MAEFDLYHSQKKEDFEQLTTRYLDGEIAFYEKVTHSRPNCMILLPEQAKQVIARLKSARQLFDAQPHVLELTMPGPRRPSIYERELSDLRLTASPLPQPSPHVYDLNPMRPVSAAIGGVSMLFGADGGRVSFGSAPTATDRTSLFNRLW